MAMVLGVPNGSSLGAQRRDGLWIKLPWVRALTKVLSILSFLVASSGCLFYKQGELGTSEVSNVDFTKISAEIMALADQRTADRVRGAESFAVEHSLVVSVKAMLDRVMSKYPPTASIDGKIEHFNRERVRLVVFASDQPLAQTYPNGMIFVNAGLVDPRFHHAAKNEAQLAGVLAHEVFHLHVGHVLLQWILLEAHQRQLTKSILAWVSTGMPGISYTYRPGATYDEAAFFDRIAEYQADLGAIATLSELEYDAREYVVLLNALRDFGKSQAIEGGRSRSHLVGRAACLKRLIEPTAAIYHYVVTIGSGKHQTKREKDAPLSASDQYTLCVHAHLYASEAAAERVDRWLAEPTNGTLIQVLESLPQKEIQPIAQWLAETMLSRYGLLD